MCRSDLIVAGLYASAVLKQVFMTYMSVQGLFACAGFMSLAQVQMSACSSSGYCLRIFLLGLEIERLLKKDNSVQINSD